MAVSELPGNPNAVWTVKKNIDGTLYWLHTLSHIGEKNPQSTQSFEN